MKVGSLYAGIGGIDLGFQKAGFQIIWSNEWDKNACITYRENFGSSKLIEGDVWKVEMEKLPKIDVLCAGFPCQAFSIAGYRKGFNDERGEHFFRIMQFIEFHKPKAIFLENVKNLKGHDKGKTFKVIKEALQNEGYVVFDKVINTKNASLLPQNRERIYLVCFRKEILDNTVFNFPEEKYKNTDKNNLQDYLDLSESDQSLIYTQSFKHFDKLKKEITSENTAYQWRRQYVRENKSGVCPTLTANMGTGGHNVPLVKIGDTIRKLSPRECFRLQGFPDNYKLPKLAKSHLYKQAGNSVSVPVIELIAKEMMQILRKK